MSTNPPKVAIQPNIKSFWKVTTESSNDEHTILYRIEAYIVYRIDLYLKSINILPLTNKTIPTKAESIEINEYEKYITKYML